MAGCCGGASSVVILGESGTQVRGSGTPRDPYIVTADSEVVVRGTETSTVKTVVSGQGTPADPYIVTATATVGLSDLVDVDDLGTPEVDDVLKFNGSSWVFGQAPVSAGSVNVGTGIGGQGTGANPLKILVSSVALNTVTGLATYIDTDGNLRAERPATSAPAWAEITGKPTTFTPSAHTHAVTDIPGVRSGTAAPTSGLGSNGDIYIQYV